MYSCSTIPVPSRKVFKDVQPVSFSRNVLIHSSVHASCIPLLACSKDEVVVPRFMGCCYLLRELAKESFTSCDRDYPNKCVFFHPLHFISLLSLLCPKVRNLIAYLLRLGSPAAILIDNLEHTAVEKREIKD